MKDGKQTGYESVGFQQAQKYKTTVLTVFCSRLRLKAQAEYGELVPQMSKLARSIPGYKSDGVFVTKDEELLTLVEFEEDVTQFDWASYQEHRAAQKPGRSAFYSEYLL